MRLFRYLLCALLVLGLSLFCAAQTNTKMDHKKPAREHESSAPAGLDKSYLQKVWDAWGTLKPANAAKFYGKGNEHMFFDVAPLKYQGWAEYEKGATRFLSDTKELKGTLNDDLQIHGAGDWAWSICTVNMHIVSKENKAQDIPIRWTAIWHKHGKDWVIAHEHVSAPMAVTTIFLQTKN